MKILVVGSGGREHALSWKLAQSPGVSQVFVAPGNGGTSEDGSSAPRSGAPIANVPIAVDDLAALVAFAQKEKIGLVVPGPELPLTLGLADKMREAGIDCFGPDRFCARLEGSKAFAKEIMEAAGVPTAESAVFDDFAAAKEHILKKGAPIVVKADGLAAGKGVVVALTVDEALRACEEMLTENRFGAAGKRVVIEEMLPGEEVSLLCVCDGQKAWPLPSAQDHKRAHDGDRGPNTGGMGAYSPAPILPDEALASMAEKVAAPILREMRKRGHPFVGVLYAGLMIGPDGPRVLEYNVRFGDPECQPLLARLSGDLAGLLQSAARGALDESLVEFEPKSALGIVLASEGYPGEYEKGMEIAGLAEADSLPDVKVFHSGTQSEGGKTLSAGGRVLCVTALGENLAAAQKNAYAAMRKISMPKSFFRKDIGAKGLARGEN